jgi:translation initiation factor 1
MTGQLNIRNSYLPTPSRLTEYAGGMIKSFFKSNAVLILVSEKYYDNGSINEFLQELDRENAKVIISKEFRKFKKPTTVIKGLENLIDAASLTRELKIKLGTGGTYKNLLVILQGDHRDAVKSILIEKGINENLIEVT